MYKKLTLDLKQFATKYKKMVTIQNQVISTILYSKEPLKSQTVDFIILVTGCHSKDNSGLLELYTIQEYTSQSTTMRPI